MGERWHKSLKSECIRPGTPLSLEDGRRRVEGNVEHYNDVRLNSAIDYITPNMLAGHQQETQDGRDRKLEAAREQRKNRRQPGRVTDERITSALPTTHPEPDLGLLTTLFSDRSG